MLVFNDMNLKSVPFLIIVDKENIKMLNYFEKFRKQISSKVNQDIDFKCNFQFLNFKKEWDLLSLGFVWLNEEMKSIV